MLPTDIVLMILNRLNSLSDISNALLAFGNADTLLAFKKSIGQILGSYFIRAENKNRITLMYNYDKVSIQFFKKFKTTEIKQQIYYPTEPIDYINAFVKCFKFIKDKHDIKDPCFRAAVYIFNYIKNYDIDIVNKLLLIAIDCELTSIVNLLTKNNVNLNFRMSYDQLNQIEYTFGYILKYNTPLNIAIDKGNINLVKLLIDNGATVNTTNQSVEPIRVAMLKDNTDIVRLLIQYSTNIPITIDYDMSLLKLAISLNNNLDIIKILIDTCINVNHITNFVTTALIDAVFIGNIDTVKLLIDLGADINIINNNGDSLLHISTRRGNLNIVKFLIECGIKVDIKNNTNRTPLHIATDTCKLDIIALLINLGADINAKTNKNLTALHIASKYYDNINIVKFLIENGAEIDEINDIQETPLHVATKYSNTNVSILLIQCGANLNMKTHRYMTALHNASRYNNIQIVTNLIAHGADINSENYKGITPLMLAARAGNYDIVKFLIENNATHLGEAFILSTINNHFEISSLLLQKGVNINHKDKNGQTSLMIAQDEENIDCILWLKGLRHNK